MQLELLEGDAVREISVEAGAVFSFGGAVSDAVFVPGLLPALVTVEERGGEVFVTCARTLAVDGLWMPPGVRRLLLPHEVVELAADVQLRRPASARPRTDGTAAVLRGFLGGLGSGGDAPCLICLTGLDAGRVYPLAEAEMIIGRGTEVAVRVRDRAVSRRHARIHQRDGVIELEDCGSPNGSFVNGARVDGRVQLSPRAVIEIGQTLLRYDGPAALDAEPEVATPLPELEPEPTAEPEPASPATRQARMQSVAFWLLILLGAALVVTGVGLTVGAVAGAGT